MAKGFHSDFDNTKGWEALNKYTIQEPETKSSGRKYLRTCVPKQILVDLWAFSCARSVSWDGDTFSLLNSDEHPSALDVVPEFTESRAIEAKGRFKDKITAFHLDRGALAQFHAFDSVSIEPINSDKWRVGGKFGSTSSTGHAYSGFSARKVPDEGLMEGEPGSLWFTDNSDNEHLSPLERRRTLSLRLFLPIKEFDDLYEMLLDSKGSGVTAHSKVVIELFESEVQAGLSDGIYSDEYALLCAKDGDIAGTRARLDSIYVKIGEKKTPSEDQGDDEPPSLEADGSEFVSHKFDSKLTNELKKVTTALWVIVVILIGSILGRLI